MLVRTKLYIIGAILLVLIANFWYISHLRGNIKTLTADLVFAQAQVTSLKDTIRDLTNSKTDIEKKLKTAEEKSQQIQTRVITQIKRVPAVPQTCPEQIDWLRDRAIELQKDKVSQ